MLFTNVFASAGADALLQKGNDYYKEEQYGKAIQIYEKILNSGNESGALYFNLGNAYYKKNRIGEAILYYEKAEKLLPDDENVKFNLKLARSKIEDKIKYPQDFFLFRWVREVIDNLSSFGWAAVGSTLIFLLALCFCCYQLDLGQKIDHLIQKIYLPLIIIAVMSIYPIYYSNKSENIANYGIILQEEVNTLAAPQTGSTKLFVIHEGAKVRIKEKSNQWLKIELLNGKQGWIKKSALGVI